MWTQKVRRGARLVWGDSMTQLTTAWEKSAVHTPLIPRPRTAEECVESRLDIASAVPLAPTVAVAAGPRRHQGAATVRPWLGLVSALAVVGAGAWAWVPLPALAMSCLVVAWPVALLHSGFHQRRAVPDTPVVEARRVVAAAGRLGLACWLLPLAVAAAGFPAALGEPSALAVHLGALAALTLVLAMTCRRLIPTAATSMVVVGHPDDISAALPELSAGGHIPVAACLTRPPSAGVAASLATVPHRVGLQHAEHTLRTANASALMILPGADLDPATVRRLQWQAAAERADVYVATSLLDVHPRRVAPMAAGGLRVVHVQHPRFEGASRVLKELADRTIASAALVVLFPALLLVALAVRRDSPGPALFRQTRVGRGGTPFTMLKFRSMTTDAEAVRQDLSAQDEGAGVLFKIRDDPRITPLGAWIRKFSVDELPQLLNVVRGEMSLVGPRPALPGEVEAYDDDPRRRLAVKPGLTGLWQVSGRSDLSWEQSVRLDVTYVDNWSLRLDLWILSRTVRAVLGHRGAY